MVAVILTRHITYNQIGLKRSSELIVISIELIKANFRTAIALG